MDLTQAIQFFKPIFYLFHGEQMFPSSIDYILENSDLIQDNNVLMKRPITNQSLYDLSDRKNLYLDIDDGIITGQTNLSQVPVYAIYRETDTFYEIIYITVFPYNGSYNVLHLEKVGHHYGDIEHVSIRIKKDFTYKKEDIICVFFGAHRSEDGKWIYFEDLEFEQDRLVVYVAKDGHGNYHKPYMALRHFGLANDYFDKDIRWDPPVNILYFKDHPKFDKNTMGWMYFSGLIGENGISSVSSKSWFNGEPNPEDRKLNYVPILPKRAAQLFRASMYLSFILLLSTLIGIGFLQKSLSISEYFLVLGLSLFCIVLIMKIIIRKVSP